VGWFVAGLALAGCRGGGSTPSAPPTESVTSALNASPKTGDFVFEAGNSIVLHSAPLTVNGGDIGARGTGSGPFLSGGVAIDISSGAVVQTTHNTIADSIRLNSGDKVGDLQVNRLVNPNSGTHGSVTPLVPLPALPALAAVTPGTANLTVAGGKTVTASPGQFLTVSLGTSSVLRLNAGTYQMKDLTIGSSGRVEALGTVQILIANRLNAGSGFFIGPASGTTLTAKDIRVEVSGVNGSDGALGSSPKAAALGSNGSIRALVLAPNGTLSFASGICAWGAFLARDIDVGSSSAAYAFEDGFPNAGPTCTPASCDDGNPCTVDSCGTNGVCTHMPAMNGTTCNDGNACTQNDTCQGGVCTGGAAVTCAGADQCHTEGACVPATGCPAPMAKNDGTACDDGNACTTGETCRAGACTGGATVTCTGGDQCHTAGTCDPAGGCSAPVAVMNGTTCNDGNACTTGETCQAGVCTGGAAVACTGADQCHAASACDPTTGCGAPVALSGTPCDDGNACTTGETCLAGLCTGGAPVTCGGADQCHTVAACSPATGCPAPIALSGTACDDGNACTTGETCSSGVCTGGTAVTCPGADQCHTAGTCSPATGCSAPVAVANGTVCNDGNACTTGEACQSGTCTGGAAVTCPGADQCHTVAACSPSSGCPTPVTLANGTPCDDGNSCTTGDSCAAGACVPGSNTCVALSIEQTTFGNLGGNINFADTFTSVPAVAVVPGDTVTFTANVSYQSAFLRSSGEMDITNTGSVPFTWGSYQVTLQYQSAITHEWIPLAKASVDANGVQSDAPPLLHLFINPFFGQTVAPGQRAAFDSTADAILDADTINLLGDPAETSQIEVEFHIDTPSGPGITSDRDVTSQFAAGNLTQTGVVGVIGFGNGFASDTVPLTPNGASIAPGETVTFTGSIVARPLPPKQPGETDDQYLRSISGEGYGGQLHMNIDVFDRLGLNLLDPVITVQKSGPAQGNAGLTLHYPLVINNIGTADASGFNVVDTANGTDLGAQTTFPPSVAPGAAGTAIIDAASPVGQTPGPYTDQASITWKDRNGNVYGPVSSSFTTTLNAGHPEGYLTLTATGESTVQVIGEPLTLTAMALDQFGHPVAGLPVQLVIAGANPQTVPLVTGADGTAAFTYNGPNLGRDTATVTATINGPTLTATVPTFTWSSTVTPPPCAGRGTPLDVMLVLDASPSMFSDDQIDAANAAANAFLGDLDPTLDQAGSIVFSGFTPLSAPLSSDLATVQSETDVAFSNQVHACDGFCFGGSDFKDAFATALAELQGPRHRPGASPLIVFLSDGGNTGDDPTAEIAAVKAAGVRVIAIGYGSGVNVNEMRNVVASSPNDYFYAPSVGELSWIYGNIDQDACRTLPPVVSAGGSQGLYEVRLPASLTLQGEVHGGGPRGDVNLTSTWTEISGPAPVTFFDASSPVTDVLFTDPGTYILQLEATDGFLTTADRATITVDPAASLSNANLLVALASPGPLTVGTPELVTATLTDAMSQPISNFAVQFTVAGANPGIGSATTNASGVATFTYAGTVPGTDVIEATAIGGTATLASSTVSVSWTAAQPGPNGIVSQGWIGAPAQRARVEGLVPVIVASGVTVQSSTVSVWSVKTPGNVITLATNAAGGPGAILATLDTTTLPNGSYIIDVNGTDDHGNAQDNETLVAVAGDYKPGRVVIDRTDLKFPVAGIPITIGRHYDSLNKDKLQDFGFGWSLTVGHPDLEVDQANDVTITLPDGRRSTFLFELQPQAVGPIVLGFIAKPLFVPAPGVFGSLTADGCSTLVFDPTSADINPVCFDSIFDPTQTHYAPTTYRYTDPYGTVYTMGADGSLKSIQDRTNNILTFTANGITASTGGRDVVFVRDAQGRITEVDGPNEQDAPGTRLVRTFYGYDTAGNLIEADRPNVSVFLFADRYGYDGAHRLTSAIDPDGHTIRTSVYDVAGRLASDTDGVGNTTTYAYDVPGHKTTTTYPDTGVAVQTFDDNGMLLSLVDQLGHKTSYEYDANRNQTKKTNALGEVTKYTYDAKGNQTSSTNVTLNETTTTAYNAFSEALAATDPVGNTRTSTYDDNGVRTTLSDSLGSVAAFTSTEHGLPSTVTDAAGNISSLSYNSSGDLTQRTDRLGRVTSYGYSGSGRKTTITDPRGGVTTYFYDADLRLTGATNPLEIGRSTGFDPAGNVQEIRTVRNYLGILMEADRHEYFTYDAANRPITIVHGDDSSQIQQTWDFRGNRLSKTDELGRVTHYEYDLAGRLTKTTYPDGTFTQQSFDALGRLATKTDERNNSVTYGYEPGCDCSDRVTRITDALGRTTSFGYDGMSRKTSMTDANNHQTTYQYDLRGRLTETDYPDGTSTIDTYDALGRKIASKDQTGVTTQYGYDAEGQITSVTDPLGHVTQYAYDPNGNLTSVTDANSHVTTYGYDTANRKTSRTLPLGMTESFVYDINDNVISHTDFRGKTATYGFDQRYPTGRPTSKVPDPSLGEPTVTYAYYANGPRQTMTDASGATSYTYDLRDRLLTKATPEGTLTYTYDASGNVASIDSSNANGTSVGYAWDAANQLSTVTDNELGGITTAAYTATGRPSSVVQPNGVGATYVYDSLDRVTSMAWQKGTSSTLATWVYSYDQRGQRLSSTEITGREAAYAYDAASRLTSETITGDPSGASGNGALTYSLDPFGNRQSLASTLAALGAQTFSCDPNDQLTSDGYDLNGNTTSSSAHTYGYDFENRLISRDGGAVSLVYDGDGNRVAKTAGGVTTQYLVDALNPTGYLQVMEETSGGTVQVRYVYGSRVVSQTLNVSMTPTTSYYGCDAHGSVAFLTDPTGHVTDTYDYDAFGNPIAHGGSTPNTRLYGGEEFDPDLGLINLRARQYSATSGRFFTLDPLDLVASGPRDPKSASAIVARLLQPLDRNRFLYATADPINKVDPAGREDEEEVETMEPGDMAMRVLALVIDVGDVYVHLYEIGKQKGGVNSGSALGGMICAGSVDAVALIVEGMNPFKVPPEGALIFASAGFFCTVLAVAEELPGPDGKPPSE
jgi:RHS repeat-associated protein